MSITVGAIIVAAGSSSRMGGIDKLWIDLGGEPLLARTIAAVASAPGLKQLLVAASPSAMQQAAAFSQLPALSRVHRWVSGGATRQDSVYNALEALEPCDVVVVHDGARPLVSSRTLRRGIEAALEHGAVIAGTPVTDTIKVVDEHEAVTATIDRRTLRAAQTPQVFRYAVLRAAYRAVGPARAGCTDDGGVVELAGGRVHVFAGEAGNIKVSTAADIAVVRALWALREEEADRA